MAQHLTFSTPQLASLLGVSARRIQQLVNAGVFSRTAHGTYDSRAVRSFIAYRERAIRAELDAGGYTKARADLMKERVLAAKSQRLERDGLMLPVLVVIRLVSALFAIVRSRALALPTKLAPELHASRSVPAVQQVLNREIREMLTGLAETDEPTIIEAMAKASPRYRKGAPKRGEPPADDQEEDADYGMGRHRGSASC